MTTIIGEKAPVMIRPFSRYRFVIAGVILAANFSIGLQWSSISPLLPLAIADLKITAAMASLLVALPILLKSLVGLPGSVITSRFGLKPMFTISGYMIGSLVLSALAPGFYTLLLLRLLYGIGIGLMMPAIGTLVMQWFPQKERAMINSMNLVVMSLGTSVSFAVAAPLAGVMSWKGVLSVYGAFAFIGAVAWHLLGRTQSETQSVPIKISLKDVWEVLSNRIIFLLFLGDSLVFVLYAALTNWLPTFFYEFRGMTLAQAGNITGLLPFVGIFSVVIGGFLTQKVKNKKLFFIIPGIMVVLGGFGSFLLENSVGIFISVLILGVGTWIYQPILLSLPMELPWMTPSKIAIVWGASMTVAGFGMFLAPIVVGVSRDIFGSFLPGFIICVIPASMLIFSGVFLPQDSPVKIASMV